MGRKIELSVNEKTYIIEFNNIALYSVVDIQEKIKNAKTFTERLDGICELTKCGLLKNHPEITKEEVYEIVTSIGDLEGFIKAILEVIESSVEALKVQKGNAHWVVK